MNLIVGIWWKLDVNHIKKLLLLGVREFFIGYIPDYWVQTFWYALSPNRRYAKEFQVSTFQDFVFLSKLLKKSGAKVFFTLNDHNYSQEGFVFLERVIADTKSYVDGYIVANVWLLSLLKDSWKEIHISGDSCVFTPSSLEFYVENGATRVILPRNITLDEIREIALFRNNNFPNLELEVFVNDSLLYTCWLCTSFHGEEDYIFCRDPEANIRNIVHTKTWEVSPILFDVNSEIISKNCSLCFLKNFLYWGINSFKIPGRTWELNQLIKRVIELKSYVKTIEPTSQYHREEYNHCWYNHCMYEC